MMWRRRAYEVVHLCVPRPAVWAYVVAVNLLYLMVRVHTPMTIIAGAPVDDTLFMSLGGFLANGMWLGPYGQYTLVKGPGYPAFLAVSNLLGTPASFATALFHCSAITFFVIACHRFVKSLVISGVLLTLLVWHPISLTVYLLRILRDTMYYAQVFLLFGLLILTLFYAIGKRQRALYAILSGAVYAWFWLTREEGVWILPGVAVLLVTATMHAVARGKLRQLVWTVVTIVVVFAVPLVAYRTINWWMYGLFVSVDFKEANYQRALAAVHSVRSGRVAPHISATRETRQRIYAVSPTFASLQEYFEGPSAGGWVNYTCDYYPSSCGEIAAGWFVFALRDAARVNGHYQTPAKASAFFAVVADEISAACARKALECQAQAISEMPQFTLKQLMTDLWTRYRFAVNMILFVNPPPQINPSTPDGILLDQRLYFLHYPRYQRSSAAIERTYMMSGWYWRSAGEWISASAQDPTGKPVAVVVERGLSPDLVAAFKDPAMANQRFLINVRCRDDCTLRLEAAPGAVLEKKLAELPPRATAFKIGGGYFHIDETRAETPPVAVVHPSDQWFQGIRSFVLTHYYLVFVPVLLAGVLAFAVATVRYARSAVSNLCYAVALVAWVLAFARLSLLILMEQTATLRALNPFYGAPAYFLVVTGAVLSIAAIGQLIEERPARGGSSDRPAVPSPSTYSAAADGSTMSWSVSTRPKPCTPPPGMG